MREKTVLVTGAGGFIGSHVVERLLKAGHGVHALVAYDPQGHSGWLSTLDRSCLDRLTVLRGDIRDYNFVRRAMGSCETVLHLAAHISIPYSYVSPRSFIETNIIGTLNVLEAAREVNTSRVVLTSTSEVYGSAQFIPMTESHPLVAQSPYAASKIGADQLGLSYYRSFGTPVTIIRPFNTFGPRQSARAVIPALIKQMLFGDGTVRVGNVSTSRDFVFVSDTAEAFLATLENNDINGRVLNIATGENRAISAILEVLQRIIGKSFKIQTEEQRIRPELSEVQRLCGDGSLAADLLGWKPRFVGDDGFKEALRLTVEFFRSADKKAIHEQAAYQI